MRKKAITAFALIVAALIIGSQAAQAQSITLGNRIPSAYFITAGMGESDVGVHTGSYDAALKDAGIENCNIMTYSSVMPPEAREVTGPVRLHHGSVLETIMADMSGNRGERLTAGLITWNIEKDGKKIGGFVAEYHGHGSEEAAKANLKAALKGMNARRGYSPPDYKVIDERIIMKSFVPKQGFGTVMVVIGFVEYIFPVVKK